MNVPGNGAFRRRLPIGVQTFRTIREEGRCYVDKTPCVGRLADGGGHAGERVRQQGGGHGIPAAALGTPMRKAG